MSFQQRTLIALALCALVYLISDFFLPKPPEPEVDPDAVAQVEGKTPDTTTAAASVMANSRNSEPVSPPCKPIGA